MDTADARERLAKRVKARRKELELSVRGAAQEAGIDRITWTAAETGERSIRSQTHGKIERVLGWTSGSIEAILDGEEPQLRQPVLTIDMGAIPPIAQQLRVDLDYILRLDMPATVKLETIHKILAVAREADEERQRAEGKGTPTAADEADE